MKTTIRQALGYALLAICPGLAFAQSDTADTVKAPDDKDMVNVANMQVYLQAAHTDMSTGNAIANPVGGGGPPPFMSPAYLAEIAAFQSYQNDLTQVIDLQQDTRRLIADYKAMVDEASHAARTKDPAEQRHLFENFLHESKMFLRDHFDPSYELWIWRAIAALDLNKPATGAQAGQFLSMMPPQQLASPRIQRILAVLDKQGWLPKAKPADAKPNPVPPVPDKPGK